MSHEPPGEPPVPYQSPTPHVVPVSNSAATCALFFGIIGLFLGPLCFVALGCGISGPGQAKKLNGLGHSSALAGLILSLVTIGLWILFWTGIAVAASSG